MANIPKHQRRSLRERIGLQSLSRKLNKERRQTMRRLSPIDETGTWTTVPSVHSGGKGARRRRTNKKR
jgi:hypothetical protein